MPLKSWSSIVRDEEFSAARELERLSAEAHKATMSNSGGLAIRRAIEDAYMLGLEVHESLVEQSSVNLDEPLLTEDERECLNALALATNKFAAFMGYPKNTGAENDFREVCDKIHQLQSMVMSQVCARLVPGFRLLGGHYALGKEQPDNGQDIG